MNLTFAFIYSMNRRFDLNFTILIEKNVYCLSASQNYNVQKIWLVRSVKVHVIVQSCITIFRVIISEFAWVIKSYINRNYLTFLIGGIFEYTNDNTVGISSGTIRPVTSAKRNLNYYTKNVCTISLQHTILFIFEEVKNHEKSENVWTNIQLSTWHLI